jgi:DNA-binding MarR family transcriptional regulator
MATVHPRGSFCEPIRGTHRVTTIERLEVRLANQPSYGQTPAMTRETAARAEKATGDRQRRSEALAIDLREVAGALVRRLRAESAGQALSMSQAGVLARLEKSGPRAVADLARMEHVTPQSMGTTVASLEAEGLVARTVDRSDARRWNASLTAAGRRVLLEGRSARQAWLSRAIEERLVDGEQRRLADGVALLRKVLGE